MQLWWSLQVATQHRHHQPPALILSLSSTPCSLFYFPFSRCIPAASSIGETELHIFAHTHTYRSSFNFLENAERNRMENRKSPNRGRMENSFPFILLFPEMEKERDEDTNDVMKKFEHIQTEHCVCSCTTALNCSHFLQTLGSNDDEKKRCARWKMKARQKTHTQTMRRRRKVNEKKCVLFVLRVRCSCVRIGDVEKSRERSNCIMSNGVIPWVAVWKNCRRTIDASNYYVTTPVYFVLWNFQCRDTCTKSGRVRGRENENTVQMWYGKPTATKIVIS